MIHVYLLYCMKQKQATEEHVNHDGLNEVGSTRSAGIENLPNCWIQYNFYIYYALPIVSETPFQSTTTPLLMPMKTSTK